MPAVSAMPDAGPASELTIRWRVSASAADEPLVARDPAPLNQFLLVAQRPVTGLVRERAPQLSTDSLVVIVVDGSGREVAWQQVRDPRIIRAESPGPNGELSGQTLYRPLTDLVVTIPEGLSPAALRVCEVQWNGTEFVLQDLGDVAVAR